MARLILSDIISDIRGTVGTHVYSYWKGVHLVKNRSVNYRTAHESVYRQKHNVFIARLAQYWQSGLTPTQRNGWKSYAAFIETLGPPYYGPTVIKLTGLRQYGGIMSGVNAFILTNQLRRSVGLTDIQVDDPEAEDFPPVPTFDSITFLPGPPKVVRVSLTPPIVLSDDTYLRIFCRGHRMAHLIIALISEVAVGGVVPWDEIYNCNVEPDAATPAWVLVGTDFCAALGTFIEINTVTPGGVSRCAYNMAEAGLNNANGWIFEARMRVDASAAQDDRLIMIVSDGAWREWISFSEAGIILHFDGGNYAMDTTDGYHVYRMAGKGNEIKVYVDGVLRITGVLTNANAAKFLYFGDGSAVAGQNSVSRWDYLKWYLTSNLAPTPAEYDFQVLRYAKGAELSLQNELLDLQCDHISAHGRYSAPSVIRSVGVHDPFLGGLWGSYIWNTFVWDG